MENTLTYLAEWVENYTSDIYSWALHKVSDPELARDIVQDTSPAAAEKIGDFKGESPPQTWLFAILNHKIIDYYRKRVKQPVKLDNQTFSTFFDEEGNWKTEKRPAEWDEDSHLLDDNEFQLVLKQCLDALPESWNTCVKLKYLSEKKGEEICQELNISPTNYWQIIHRAKLQLRVCIEQNWFSK